ncbi:MAG: hypothetical protein GVY35_06225, partial [Bacteroidetes bacterium]|nr:hypothetical protein [Bacteroidota bacterium]
MPDQKDFEGARVLFVDDNKMLHDVLDRLLSRHGIQVTSLSNADRAIEALDD